MQTMRGSCINAVSLCLLIAAFCSGCRNAQIEAELARVQEQLAQADIRLNTATAQIANANQQVENLSRDVALSRAELDKAREDAEIARQQSDKKIRELEIRNSDLENLLGRARDALAAAEQKMRERESAETDEEIQLSIAGVWTLDVAGVEHLFAFYEDGTLLVRGVVDGGRLVPPRLTLLANNPFAETYVYQRLASNKFGLLADAHASGTARKGGVTITNDDNSVILLDLPVVSESTGPVVRPDVDGRWKKMPDVTPAFYDEFGKPKPLRLHRKPGLELPERAPK